MTLKKTSGKHPDPDPSRVREIQAAFQAAYPHLDFSDHFAAPNGGISPLRDSDKPLLQTWAAHQELGELSVGAVALALKSIRAATGGRGGIASASTKKEAAAKSKAQAVSRFKILIATGDRDADEAIKIMLGDGWKKSTLYRYLKEELNRLGRGWKKHVK